MKVTIEINNPHYLAGLDAMWEALNIDAEHLCTEIICKAADSFMEQRGKAVRALALGFITDRERRILEDEEEHLGDWCLTEEETNG